MFRLVSILFVIFCGCPKSHPVELIALPDGETIISIQSDSELKVVTRLRGKISEKIEWDLPLNQDGGSAWGGEKLYPLEDGRFIYCGMAFDPAMVQSCWVVDREKTARIKEPVLPANPSLMDSASRTVGFASNGAWWVTKGDGLEFSPSRDELSTPLNMPFQGPYQHVDYSPETDLFALTTEGKRSCQIVVMSRQELKVVDTFPLNSCHVKLLWSPDGKKLGIAHQHAISLWSPGGGKTTLTTRFKGPDGRDEEIHFLGFSPDGTHVLVRSSRHQNMAHNPLAGVHNAVLETFVIDVKTREWKRLRETGNIALWRKD